MHLRARADAVSVGSTHEASRWMCISSCDQWNLTPATMCPGSAACYMKQKLWSSRPCICTSATTFFFYLGKKSGGGGGRAINRQTAIFVAASPRWEKIQYRHSPSIDIAHCVLMYTQSALQSCGGGCLSSTTTSVQHLDDVRQCAHHTPGTGGEERVIEPIK